MFPTMVRTPNDLCKGTSFYKNAHILAPKRSPDMIFTALEVKSFMTNTRGYLPAPVDPKLNSTKSKNTNNSPENIVPARPSERVVQGRQLPEQILGVTYILSSTV